MPSTYFLKSNFRWPLPTTDVTASDAVLLLTIPFLIMFFNCWLCVSIWMIRSTSSLKSTDFFIINSKTKIEWHANRLTFLVNFSNSSLVDAFFLRFTRTNKFSSIFSKIERQFAAFLRQLVLYVHNHQHTLLSNQFDSRSRHSHTRTLRDCANKRQSQQYNRMFRTVCVDSHSIR